MHTLTASIKGRAGSILPAFIFSWLPLCIALLAMPSLSGAQQLITVSGKAMDKDFPALLLEQVMVINLRTQQGVFGNTDNTFRVKIDKNDTLIITALGYRSDKICFRDSVFREEWDIIVPLKKISITLQEATVFIPRNLNRIEEDIKKLGYSAKDYRLSGVDAWQSPLTALYQAFSRKERSKRKVAELMNEDKRRELLREVLANYSRAGLIDLRYNEYNAFIDYLGLNDFLLQSFTQYELAVFVKEKYFNYMAP